MSKISSAKEFLKAKGILSEDAHHLIIDLPDGREINIGELLEDYHSQFTGEAQGVYAVDLSWGIKYHPTDLSNVMKPEECRFIGTAKECADFIRDRKPVPIPAQGYSKEQIIDAYNAGYRDGEQDAGNPPPHKKDISQFSNAADYFSTIFTDNADSQQ